MKHAIENFLRYFFSYPENEPVPFVGFIIVVVFVTFALLFFFLKQGFW